ncbi:MAG: LexA repressor [Alteromonadaceae bacterium]|nr:LexA repressor [Alteromonadaceae bacterium]MBL6901755.1 repressor LexA [Luminiphilus sp.]RCL46699.1 MAG: repressor LexA [Halieaceae bacterium]RPH10395.1 MAG: repressor LexA [Alteromonadaceae bacterium TMED101]HBQ03079.1 LexA repressor [Halieaceae bacterium]
MIKLTARQQQVMDVVRSSIDATGMPPTRADIARELGFKSVNAAEEHLKALAKKGAIELIAGASRGIRLTEQTGLPIIGRVAAGEPLLAQAHIEDYCDLSASFFSPTAHFLLQVCGDSMINVGIFDGDLLAVHSTREVRQGQIAVVRIDDEVTVKRWKRISDTRVDLTAENDNYAPIELDLTTQDVVVEGISVGVIRR